MSPAIVPKAKHSSGLPAAVSHIYYKHGLFIASYPTCATSIAIMAILFACYPLVNIPLPGTIPTKIVVPLEANLSDIYVINEDLRHNVMNSQSQINDHYPKTNNNININAHNNNLSSVFEAYFSWAQRSPILYIQQIMVRASVMPWNDEMHLMDAFRAPLYEIFSLNKIIRNHVSMESHRGLDQICWHVDNVKSTNAEQIFPEFNCLMLSPANLWSESSHNFAADSNILNTIYRHHHLQKSKVSTAEMVFGLPIQDTGFKRYPLRSRPRIVQYAVTLILKQYDPDFIQSLKQKLLKYYPPPFQDDNQQTDFQRTPERLSLTYIFYPGEFRVWDFMPLTTAYVVLFAYIYFSVRKLDMIRSRILLAWCATITILGSLIMSLGLCFFFGLTISWQSKDIFPYLVILLGLENCLVITRSVVSINETFDVKIRMAQALSKEGWHITKTLLTEITILTIGLATFVPVIQEFSVFAIVGLLSDFLLQLLLFSTTLAFNIKRSEYSTEAKHLPKMRWTMATRYLPCGSYSGYSPLASGEFSFFGNADNAGVFNSSSDYLCGGSFYRSQSHPKLTNICGEGGGGISGLCNLGRRTSGVAGIGSVNGIIRNHRIPKRLRIVNFWARTRFFQRAFMVWMSVWICSIIYNSGYLEQLLVMPNNNQTMDMKQNTSNKNMNDKNNKLSKSTRVEINSDGMNSTRRDLSQPLKFFETENFTNIHSKLKGTATFENEDKTKETNSSYFSAGFSESYHNLENELKRLQPPAIELNYLLSNFHWSDIMKQYNVSLKGNYVLILPTIKISLAIRPERAIELRHPNENFIQNFQWKALAAALDPLDLNDDLEKHGTSHGSMITAATVIAMQSTINLGSEIPLFPKSPMEIFFVITLCCISVLVLCYTMVVFYRCICTRNYAEWRSSWYESQRNPSYIQNNSANNNNQSNVNNISNNEEHVLEGIPSQIIGHKHRIECLATDGYHIISCCLKGQIKVWDARTGDNVTIINRELKPTNSECDNYELQTNDAFKSTDNSSKLHLTNYRKRCKEPSPIWCLDYYEGLIAVGCGDGRIELWESTTGLLKCFYSGDSKRHQGITHIHLNGDRVIAARLCGRLDFYRLETYYRGQPIDWGFTAAYRRVHTRTSSTGSIGMLASTSQYRQQIYSNQHNLNQYHTSSVGANGVTNAANSTENEEMRCSLQSVRLAHQQPITCMEVVNDIVFTGSQDHTLKVYNLRESEMEHTLHGHCGPITCLFVDRWQPNTGGSGSQDGLLCVWDILGGMCMYSIQAHDGAINCLVCAPNYVISLGVDERVCVWERVQGNLLTTINISNPYSSLLMLTPSLLVTSKMGSLIVWDVRNGEPAREVKLDFANHQLTPKVMMLASGSIVCDYGNEIRVVRFPIVADKNN